MPETILTEAKERWQEASDHYQDERLRMQEDLRFSNPAKPEQWDAKARAERQNAEGGARPCLTLDYTNQFIAQVVNDARQNKPGIQVGPSDNQGTQQSALALEGMVRQIEYESRASIAYDRGIDHAARCGRGWIRVGTKIVNPQLNWQELTIMSVHDPLSIMIDPDSTEPDGSDSMFGFVEAEISKRAFKRKLKALGKNPDDSHTSWGNGLQGASDKFIRIAEHFWIVANTTKHLALQMPDGSMRQILADEREMVQQQVASETGVMPKVLHDYSLSENSCKWVEMSGSDVLDSRDFPCQWIPLVPVLGHELWVDGKRYLCGLTRQLMDAQRLKNFERSAWVEVLQMQPRAPWVLPFESLEGFEDVWAKANRSNSAFLPYNGLDEEGRPLPPPQRQGPPMAPTAFAQGSSMALDDMQASVGMYRSNFGAPSNSVSGKAKLADQREGDTATYHYVDNLSRSVAHVGRICVDIIPRIQDTRREVRTLSLSGATKVVQVDPDMQKAFQDTPTGQRMNPKVGSYAVRVKSGPAYNTLRQEAADNLNELLAKNPALMSILGPIWAQMQDWPEADKVAKLLLSMAPKPVQDIYNDESNLPPEAQGIVMQLQQQLQQGGQQMQEMQAVMEQMRMDLMEKQTKAQIDMRAAQSNEDKLALDAQVRMGELALKERELGLREREMGIRELEAAARAQGSADGGQDEVKAVLEARKVEIQAYEAETKRIQVEQDGLIAQKKAEQEAAALAVTVVQGERDREAQADTAQQQDQQQAEGSASEPAEAAVNAGMASALMLALQTLQQTVDSLTASRNKVARVTKVGDGTWQMESVETPAEQPGANELEGEDA
jgi:Phage P22-like portal protein